MTLDQAQRALDLLRLLTRQETEIVPDPYLGCRVRTKNGRYSYGSLQAIYEDFYEDE